MFGLVVRGMSPDDSRSTMTRIVSWSRPFPCSLMRSATPERYVQRSTKTGNDRETDSLEQFKSTNQSPYRRSHPVERPRGYVGIRRIP